MSPRRILQTPTPRQLPTPRRLTTAMERYAVSLERSRALRKDDWPTGPELLRAARVYKHGRDCVGCDRCLGLTSFETFKCQRSSLEMNAETTIMDGDMTGETHYHHHHHYLHGSRNQENPHDDPAIQQMLPPPEQSPPWPRGLLASARRRYPWLLLVCLVAASSSALTLLLVRDPVVRGVDSVVAPGVSPHKGYSRLAQALGPPRLHRNAIHQACQAHCGAAPVAHRPPMPPSDLARKLVGWLRGVINQKRMTGARDLAARQG